LLFPIHTDQLRPRNVLQDCPAKSGLCKLDNRRPLLKSFALIVFQCAAALLSPARPHNRDCFPDFADCFPASARLPPPFPHSG
jgi:hypothetical protein